MVLGELYSFVGIPQVGELVSGGHTDGKVSIRLRLAGEAFVFP